MSDALPPPVTRAFAHLAALFDFTGVTAQEEIMAVIRAGIEHYGDAEARGPDGDIKSLPVRIGALEAEWLCAPGANPARRILYLHGGGLISGTLRSHRTIPLELARRTGFAVLNLQYRLAPEHVFPAAHDDAAEACDWVAAQGPGGAAPAQRLAIVGDSAGGNLALATWARRLAQKARLADALVLLGPCLDNTVNPARPQRASDPVINDQAVAPMALYAAGMALDDPRISPLFLPDAVLAQLPPTLIQASAGEFLFADAQTLSRRLTALGRRHVFSVWPTLPHDWHLFAAILPDAGAAFDEIAAFLKA